MKALDTNVIIRFLIQDDPVMTSNARRIFTEAKDGDMPLLISDLVLLEILWVLKSAYGFSREAVLGAIQDLACLPCICFQSHNRIQEFIRLGLSTPFDLLVFMPKLLALIPP